MLELIISLILAASTLIGTVWGIVKYYDVKRTKKETEAVQREEERDKILKTVAEQLKTIALDNAAQHRNIEIVQEEIVKINLQIQNIQEQIDENEMDRLRSDIINCVNKLQNGLTMSQADFEHIHHCFDKYISKGGNSYIQSCMDYVIDYEEECRRNGVRVGFDTP